MSSMAMACKVCATSDHTPIVNEELQKAAVEKGEEWPPVILAALEMDCDIDEVAKKTIVAAHQILFKIFNQKSVCKVVLNEKRIVSYNFTLGGAEVIGFLPPNSSHSTESFSVVNHILNQFSVWFDKYKGQISKSSN